MSDAATIDSSALNTVANMTIADLTESTPEAMSILAPIGIDMCCGGGRPLGEALELHGIDPDPVIRQIALLRDSRLEK